MNSSRDCRAPIFHGTTIVAVRAKGKSAMAGDGQVTMESGSSSTVIKAAARKVRRLYGDRVLCGFAGSVGDAFTLFDKLGSHLEESSGDLMRAAVNLAKEWRTDRVLRQLQAVLLCMDAEHILLVSGTGEVIEPDEPVLAIGSGGPYALAAARALLRHTDLDGPAIAREALKLAAEICIYTNDNITVEEI